MRSSLAVNYTAHVADSQKSYSWTRVFSNTSARADSQKFRSPVPLNEQPCSQTGESKRFSLPKGTSLCPTALTSTISTAERFLESLGSNCARR